MKRGMGFLAACAMIATLQPGAAVRAENVNGVWQEQNSKRCREAHRCEVFFTLVNNPQQIHSVSCVIETTVGGNFPTAVVLGAGVNNANFKPRWNRDGAYIPAHSTFTNGFKITVLANTLFAVKTFEYPAVRADFGQNADINMHCTIAGPNNQP